MSGLRVIYDNATDRATLSLVSGAVQPTLGLGNLLTDEKLQPMRTVGTSFRLRLTWPSEENVAGAFFPACNFTADAVMRVCVYDAAGGTLLADTGPQYPCSGLSIDLWDWADALNVNAFAWGGASKAGLWLDDTYPTRCVEIEVSDPDNDAGWLDMSRLVVGGYWSPARGAQWGAKSGPKSNSTQKRLDSGELKTRLEPSHDEQALDIKGMREADRVRLVNVLRGHDLARFVLLSRHPEHAQATLEQEHVIYGSLQGSTIGMDGHDSHSGQLVIKGW